MAGKCGAEDGFISGHMRSPMEDTNVGDRMGANEVGAGRARSALHGADKAVGNFSSAGQSGHPHQTSSDNTSPPITLLTRTTKIQQTVAMDCGNRSGKRDAYSSTNLHPREMGLASFDSWPDSVWSIKLINIEVTNGFTQEV